MKVFTIKCWHQIIFSRQPENLGLMDEGPFKSLIQMPLRTRTVFVTRQFSKRESACHNKISYKHFVTILKFLTFLKLFKKPVKKLIRFYPLILYLRTMVFSGQDAWRKYPIFSDCHKNPIPNLRVAVGIFAGLVVADFIYSNTIGKCIVDLSTWHF